MVELICWNVWENFSEDPVLGIMKQMSSSLNLENSSGDNKETKQLKDIASIVNHNLQRISLDQILSEEKTSTGTLALVE